MHIYSQVDFVLPGMPRKKAKSAALVIGGDEDPRGLLRLADVAERAAAAKAKVAPAPSGVAAKGKAKGKALAAAPLAPAAKPPPKAKGKATGKAKAPALAGSGLAPPPPPKAASSSHDDFVVVKAAGKAVPVAAAPREERGWKPALGEGKVCYKEYRAFGVGDVYRNWIFSCPHHGGSCQRTLGVVPRNTRHHGDLEPLAFLHVWRDVPPGPQGHRKTNPKPEDVTAFFNAYQGELAELAAQWADTP